MVVVLLMHEVNFQVPRVADFGCTASNQHGLSSLVAPFPPSTVSPPRFPPHLRVLTVGLQPSLRLRLAYS